MKQFVHFNSVLIILILLHIFMFTENMHAASNSIQPDWVDNWRNIYSDEIIGYMLAWSPLYMFLKQPIRRFI